MLHKTRRAVKSEVFALCSNCQTKPQLNFNNYFLLLAELGLTSLVPRPKQPQRGSLAVSRAGKRSALGLFGSGNETTGHHNENYTVLKSHKNLRMAYLL